MRLPVAAGLPYDVSVHAPPTSESRIFMGRVTDTISTLNSAVRTAVAGLFLLLAGASGWVVYDKVTAEQRRLNEATEGLAAAQQELQQARDRIGQQMQQIETLRGDLTEANAQIQRLETSMRLLKMDQRLAQLKVINQETTEVDGQQRIETTVQFVELTPDGDPIGKPRQFTLQGDLIYLDNWVVKFEDRFVEQADLQRGTSLALFRRIFGEYQNPVDGFALDEVGGMPQAYARGGQPSEFEQKIWSDFWTFANDREKAEAMGIRAAHGEAVSIKAKEGQTYLIVLRASDGLSIEPVEG